MSGPQPLTRILIADESELTQRTLRAVLEAEGYDVIQAGDGIDALTILCLANDILVVIVGAHLPDMEAEDMLNIVEQDAHLRSRHAFIVLAQYDGDPAPALSRYLAHLGIPILARPLDREDLIEAVEHAIARQRVRSVAPLLQG